MSSRIWQAICASSSLHMWTHFALRGVQAFICIETRNNIDTVLDGGEVPRFAYTVLDESRKTYENGKVVL